MTSPVRGIAFVLLILAAVLVAALAITAVVVAVGSERTASSVEGISNRRSATIDALHTDAVRQECVDRTEIHWMRTLTQALLLPPDSPEQAAAVQRLGPVADELGTVEQRCYDENPLPSADEQQPAGAPPQVQPAGSSSAESGEDGRDGVDGRNGRDGADGADGADGTPGSSGTAGQDGRDGTAVVGPPGRDGADGRDSIVPGPAGPAGPPGESVTGPAGPHGEPGRDGYDGSPPLSFTVDVGGVAQVCTDPDGDLNYTCMPATVG